MLAQLLTLSGTFGDDTDPDRVELLRALSRFVLGGNSSMPFVTASSNAKRNFRYECFTSFTIASVGMKPKRFAIAFQLRIFVTFA